MLIGLIGLAVVVFGLTKESDSDYDKAALYVTVGTLTVMFCGLQYLM